MSKARLLRVSSALLRTYGLPLQRSRVESRLGWVVVGTGTAVFWAVSIVVVEDSSCGSSAMAEEDARLSPTEAMVAKIRKRSTLVDPLQQRFAFT